MTEQQKKEIKKTLDQAGLEHAMVCTLDNPGEAGHGEEYIVFVLKAGAFVKGNWKTNVVESLRDLVTVSQDKLHRFQEVIDNA